MDRIIDALKYFHIFFWACHEVFLRIKYRGHFYIVVKIENGTRFTINPMLHESFVQEKTEYIQKLSKRLPQEAFIEEAIREALYTIRFLIFHIPRNENQFVQFLFDYKNPGAPFMLEISALHDCEDVKRMEKIKSLLQRLHYYPFTQDAAILETYVHDFVGFYHFISDEDLDYIHIFYEKTKIKEAARVTSLFMHEVFNYKGRMKITVGDALDEYLHND